MLVLDPGRLHHDSAESGETLPNRTRTPVLFPAEMAVMHLSLALLWVQPASRILAGLEIGAFLSSVVG